VVTFASTAATPASVATLIDNITYQNLSQTPAPSRTISVTVDDGDGAASTPVTSEIIVFPAIVGPVDNSSVRFRQTGLMQQLITISNAAPFAFEAVRVTIQLSDADKAAQARIYDATGTNAAGDAFLQYNATVPPGGVLQFVVEYYVPDRVTIPNPQFIVELLLPQILPPPVGTDQIVLRQTVLPPDGAILLDFATQSGGRYFILYSSDMVNWKAAEPSVLGTGSTLQWVDDGPPKTDSRPANAAERFYKILKAN
jgi:hypothetical protein